MNLKNQIKNSLQMERVLAHYRFEKTANNQYFCKGHPDKEGKRPSLVLHPNSQTITCKSKGCFEGDDIFGVIGKMESLDPSNDFKKILNRAALIAGMSIPNKSENSVLKGVTELTEEHKKYLNKRGILDETIHHFGLKSLYDKIIFMYKQNGQLIGYKAKTTIPSKRWKEQKNKDPKWVPYFIKGKAPNIWPEIDSLKKKKVLYLVGGEIDLLTFWQEIKRKDLEKRIGIFTIVTGEGSPIRSNVIEKFKELENREWRILYDDDQAGKKGMQQRAKELSQTNKLVSIFKWKKEFNFDEEDGFDINDFFLKNRNLNIFLKEKNFEEFEKIQKRIKKAKAESRRRALKLLSNSRLLYVVRRQFEKLGIAGEVKNCLMIYLTLSSRLLEKIISLIPKGDSASGKSFIVEMICHLFPKSAYVEMTSATAQSFYHAKPDEFKNKIIIVYERQGAEQTDYAIRSFQSEGKLILQITVKNKKTGDFEVKNKEVLGPIGFITTTTAPFIHPENETRVFSLYTDESEEQTEGIFEMSSREYSGIRFISERMLRKFKTLQESLRPFKVVIPYVDELKKSFPKKPTRVRRDYPRFLLLIAAVALLHQCQRDKKTIGGKEYLIASVVDFYIAQVIAEEMLRQTIFEVAPKTENLIKTAKRILKSKASSNPNSEPTFNIGELAKKLNWDYRVTYKWFRPGLEKGHFILESEQKGRQAAEYKAGKVKKIKTILPDVKELIKKYPLKDERIYNPITGKYLKFD